MQVPLPYLSLSPRLVTRRPGSLHQASLVVAVTPPAIVYGQHGNGRAILNSAYVMLNRYGSSRILHY